MNVCVSPAIHPGCPPPMARDAGIGSNIPTTLQMIYKAVKENGWMLYLHVGVGFSHKMCGTGELYTLDIVCLCLFVLALQKTNHPSWVFPVYGPRC